MKTLHKLLTTSCASLFAFLPLNVMGQQYIDIDGYKYSIRSGDANEVNLLWVPYDVTDAVIPSTIENQGVTYTVVHMSNDAVISKSGLKTLSLPATLRTISYMQEAFDDCDNLESVTVDEANENFQSKDGALYTKGENVSLVVLPRCVKGTVELLAAVDGFYEMTLEDMPNIEGLTFSEGISSRVTITNLPKLTDLSIPSSIESISITQCPVLSDISVASNNPYYEASEGVLYHHETRYSDGAETPVRAITFFSPMKTSYVIPDDVTSDVTSFCMFPNLATLSVSPGNPFYYSRDNAIYSMSKAYDEFGEEGASLLDVAGGITTFNLPSDVMYVGEASSPVDDDRFENRGASCLSFCQHLTTITADEGNPYFFASDGVLYTKQSPYGLEEDYSVKGVPMGRTGLITVPDGIKRVGGMAFYGASLSSISLPDSIIAGYAAFANCKQLAEVTFRGEGQAESTAFLGTPFLENHEPGVLYAGHTAYGMAGNLKEMVIKDGTKTIGKEAFARFEDELLLEKVTLPQGLENIESYAFTGCGNLKSINLPASLKKVFYNAFDFCTSLSEVTLEEGLTFLPNIFGDLPIRELYVPSSVKDWLMESYPSSLSNIVVSPDNAYYASLEGCLYSKDMTTLYVVPDGKSTLYIPEGIVRVGAPEIEEPYALQAQSEADYSLPAPMFGKDIETLYLPSSIQSYSYGAFNYCDKLQAVYNFSEEPTSFDEYFSLFPYNLSETVLYVPTGCVEAYQQANVWKEFGRIEEFDVTGIDEVSTKNEVKEVARYSIDGRLLTAPQPGVNIIKMSDGTTRKVIIR